MNRRRKEIHAQDGFLFECLREKKPVVLAMKDGEMLRGRIQRFDRFVILLDTGSEVMLINKHSLAAVGTAKSRT